MEPERQIEKLLRAVAKKRRDQTGDPIDLHPVARQELLREVSRRSRQNAGGGLFSNFFSALRPRLVLAVSILALVVIGGWLALPLLTGKYETSTLSAAHSDLAFTKKNAPTAAPATAAAPPETPEAAPAPNSAVPVVQPTLANSDSFKQLNAPEGAVTRDELPGAKTSISAQPAISPPLVPPAPPVESSSTAVANYQGIAGTALNSTASVAAAAAEPEAQKNLNTPNAAHNIQVNQLARFDASARVETTAPSNPNSQHFHRAIAAAPAIQQRGFGGAGGVSAAGGISPVLTSFQIEQSGPQIRVVDNDGSVYTGTWQTTPFETAAPSASAPATFAAPQGTPLSDNIATTKAAQVGKVTQAEPQAAPAQNYFFRVSGTNRNLKQIIVFSGRFIPSNHALNGGISGNVEARRAQVAGTSALPLNSRIVGKVAIGNKKEVELDANPAP